VRHALCLQAASLLLVAVALLGAGMLL